jgi:hypothetical protein
MPVGIGPRDEGGFGHPYRGAVDSRRDWLCLVARDVEVVPLQGSTRVQVRRRPPRDRAVVELDVPAGHRVEAAYAGGKKGDKSSLPEELQSIEQPNARRPLSEPAFEGGFPPAMPAGRREVLRELFLKTLDPETLTLIR